MGNIHNYASCEKQIESPFMLITGYSGNKIPFSIIIIIFRHYFTDCIFLSSINYPRCHICFHRRSLRIKGKYWLGLRINLQILKKFQWNFKINIPKTKKPRNKTYSLFMGLVATPSGETNLVKSTFFGLLFFPGNKLFYANQHFDAPISKKLKKKWMDTCFTKLYFNPEQFYVTIVLNKAREAIFIVNDRPLCIIEKIPKDSNIRFTMVCDRLNPLLSICFYSYNY